MTIGSANAFHYQFVAGSNGHTQRMSALLNGDLALNVSFKYRFVQPAETRACKRHALGAGLMIARFEL